MGREREIVKRTRELLTAAGAKIIKTSGQGEPDLVGCYMGYAIAIECKQQGPKPTKLQEFRIREWKRAGAIAFWTDFPAEALRTVQTEANNRERAARRERLKDVNL
jgi:Holliday junction resolvase